MLFVYDDHFITRLNPFVAKCRQIMKHLFIQIGIGQKDLPFRSQDRQALFSVVPLTVQNMFSDSNMRIVHSFLRKAQNGMKPGVRLSFFYTKT